MSVQYLSDEKGRITAVQVPIKEWEIIKSKYPDIAHVETELPGWHKNIIDARLDDLTKNPGRIRPVSELVEELDK
jgi:hypothetical protein